MALRGTSHVCGIAGICWNHPTPVPGLLSVRNMLDVLSHRGPDDSGIFHSDTGLLGHESAASGKSWPAAIPGATAHSSTRSGAVLGHRRLSIIDLSGGRQPLSNEDGSVWIAFNGEIYNYRELKADLAARGHIFATSTDTEVIVHLYEEYGERCLDKLRGMFALAIWDARREQVLLARDRLGQKPLFYRQHGKRLDFASELKSLLQLPDASRDVCPQAVDLYLTYQYVPHPTSILKGYHRLPPGHFAVFDRHGLRVDPYWTPPYEPGSSPQTGLNIRSPLREPLPDCSGWSLSRWRSELRETLTEAVRLRMRSDVPLGAFLSGGVDSTIIAGLMQQLSNRPVHTFSIGFPVERFDERAFAREASEMLGTEHHEQVVEPSALSILPKLIWHYDEPFSDSSAIPTMYLSEMTRQSVTVSLSGDGGDELFAGYDRYKAVRIAALIDRMPRPLRSILTARVWQNLPASVEQKSFRRRLKRLLEALGEPAQRRYLRWISIFDARRRSELLSDDVRAALGDFDSAGFIEDAYTACPSRDFVTRTTAADVLTYLPCDILTKVDIASMAFSLEARSPFLDHHVVELAARMPIQHKLHGRQGKQILIDTFADLLPDSIQSRPKMGFGVPLDHWFRNELKPLLQEMQKESMFTKIKGQCDTFTITGYSMGGGIGGLLAHILNLPNDPLKAGVTVDYLYTFGSIPIAKSMLHNAKRP
ncbi:MAG: asparagine synthase (glutamine-hydrolyzing), partial [Planctomycetaceae bacterium]